MISDQSKRTRALSGENEVEQGNQDQGRRLTIRVKNVTCFWSQFPRPQIIKTNNKQIK